jgi:hypothetical protein
VSARCHLANCRCYCYVSAKQNKRQQRTKMSCLLQYLHKGRRDVEVHPALEYVELSSYMTSNTIVSLMQRLDHKGVIDDEASIFCGSDSSPDDSSLEECSLQEELNKALSKDGEIQITRPKNEKDLAKIVKNEMILFEEQGPREPNLQKCYDYLKPFLPRASSQNVEFLPV